jgi:23S rRNA (cytidine1920-2'-O)/16S rRNA (cytidine1409-2'-O)-methyltransferase
VSKKRLDVLMVERGLAETRSQAQALVLAGKVPGHAKAGEQVDESAEIEVEWGPRFVSRGGEKLANALATFGIEAEGEDCLDVGASTGGFTEVLLTRGAALVYAVDVGRGQLHPRIRGNRRVVSLENTDARALDRALVPEPIDLMVADVSFISLRLVLPAATALLAPAASIVLLVKPQFEAGPAHVRKGIVREETVRRTVCTEIAGFVAALGFEILGIVPSPIEGRDGNREFLLGARRG